MACRQGDCDRGSVRGSVGLCAAQPLHSNYEDSSSSTEPICRDGDEWTVGGNGPTRGFRRKRSWIEESERSLCWDAEKQNDRRFAGVPIRIDEGLPRKKIVRRPGGIGKSFHYLTRQGWHDFHLGGGQRS